MAQVILVCSNCGEQVGLQGSEEEAPAKGCKRVEDGLHDWNEPGDLAGPVRVRIICDMTLPGKADPDGFADSFSEFAHGLEDPAPIEIHETRIEYAPLQTIKRLGRKEYEISGIPSGQGGMQDAHIEEGPESTWAVDTFDSAFEDPDKAHRDSRSYDSLQEALEDLLPEANS